MKRRNWKRWLSIALLVVLAVGALVAVPQVAGAFGDFDSHSDYGGSGSRSRDSDSGVDIGTVINLATVIGDVFGVSPVVVLIVIVVLILLVKLFAGKKEKPRSRSTAADFVTERGGADSLAQLQEEDPAFSGEDVKERVKELFRNMQARWEEGNIDSLHKDFMPDTWTRFNIQLQNKNAAGETAHVRNIRFEDVDLVAYTTDAEHQLLKVRLIAEYNIWTTNSEGKNIEGSENTRKRFVYVWTLMRPLGAKTGGAPADTAHCPNCGAEIDLEAFAECPFCHTPVMKISPDWVIGEMDALSQETLAK